MTAVVMGASAGVGRALSEALAARRHDLLLIAGDAEDLGILAAHLRTVHGIEVTTVVVDASDPVSSVDHIAQAAAAHTDIDALYFPIGASRRDDLGELDAAGILALVNVNLSVVAALTAYLLPRLRAQPKARIVGFGSIAAVRGRSGNIVYSAAKRGLESYFESLRHLCAGSAVRVQFIRLGYVESQQSFGQRLLFPAATPGQVAEHVMAIADRDRAAHYFPRFWSLIALAVAWLPWPLYKKLNF